MFIKELTIHGIRNFENTTFKFHERVNVIVGDNGSGKSSILFAIQLIVFEEHFALTQIERLALLPIHAEEDHSGYVQIAFDNTDRRIKTVKKDTIYVRRTLTAHSDKFAINGRLKSKNEILFMLRYAGISPRNPFYFFGHHLILRITEGGCKIRLKMLHDFIGIGNDYQIEVGKLFVSSTASLQGIRKILHYINKKPEELDNNMEMLKKIDEANLGIKKAEYNLSQRELIKEKKEYAERQHRFAQCASFGKASERQLEKYKSKLEALHSDEQEAQAALQLLSDALNGINEHSEDRAVTFGAYHGKKSHWAFNRLVKYEELCLIESHVMTELMKLNERDAAYMPLQLGYHEDQLQVFRKRVRLAAIYKWKSFSTVELRNDSVNTEIAEFRRNLDELQKTRMECTKRINDLNTEMQDYPNYVMGCSEEFGNVQKAIDEKLGPLVDSIDSYFKVRSKLRKWKTYLLSHKDSLVFLDSEIADIEWKLFDDQMKTYKVIKDCAEQLSDTGEYYGLLIENITCEECLYTAMEVVAKDVFFYHIVDSVTYATTLYNLIMNVAQDRGVTLSPFTIIPLSDVPELELELPHISHTEGIPLLDRLQYDGMLRALMKFVFGEIILCSSYENLLDIAKQYGGPCVTLDGDYRGPVVDISEEGPIADISGGYFLPRKLKMFVQNQRSHLKQEKDKINGNILTLMRKIHDLELEFSKQFEQIEEIKLCIFGKRHSLYWRRCNLYNSYMASRELKAHCEQHLVDVQRRIAEGELWLQLLQGELHRELSENLTDAEIAQAQELFDEINVAMGIDKPTDMIEAEKNVKLSIGILKLLEENREAICKKLIPPSNPEVFAVEKHCGITDALEETVHLHMEKMKRKTIKVIVSYDKIVYLYEKLDQAEILCKLLIPCWLDNHKSKRIISGKKIKELRAKILDLDLGEEEIEAWKDLQKETLENLLEESYDTRMCLKKNNPHVNYSGRQNLQLNHDRIEPLIPQLDEAEMTDVQIHRLMENYREFRESTILITYSKAEERFAIRFRRLVLRGFGALELVQPINDHAPETQPLHSGMNLMVSFNGHDVVDNLHTLSGGQKKLTTLAFLFALHDIERIPFCLIDNIDANLHDESRRNVTNEIKQMRHQSQFIMIVKTPELINIANRCFHVTSEDEIISVEQVTRGAAMDIVAGYSSSSMSD